jgi:TolB-like protein/lipopolysaccharide biosynthesis regulator YciM
LGPVLDLSLCGVLAARRASGERLDLPSRKAGLLLAFLAMQPDGRATREQAIAHLWSDRGEAQARASMRQELLGLRKCLAGLAPSPLRIEGEELALDHEATRVDAVEFEQLCRSGSLASLERAVDLCRGEFLDGVLIRDPVGEEWLRAERSRLHDLLVGALRKLLGHHLRAGAIGAATQVAQRLVAADPLREDAHRALIALYAAGSGRGPALRHVETARNLFRRELDIELEPATIRLAQRIRKANDSDGVVETLREISAAFDTAPPPKLDAASVMASEAPAIAVLPFSALGGDGSLDVFGDGLVDGVTGALSRVRSLFVISRASTQKYRDVAPDLAQIGNELGVRYLLLGNLQLAGQHVRVRSQLVEGASGAMLWSDTCDGALEDVFELQDRITERIVAAIAPSVRTAEIERALRKRPDSLAAYDVVMRALPLIWTMSREAHAEATRLTLEATRLDPRYAVAYAYASWCHFWGFVNNWTDALENSRAEAFRLIHTALRLDANDPHVLSIAALAETALGHNLDAAEAYVEKALALDPNFAWAWIRSGYVQMYKNRIELALEHFERAARLSPFDPLTFNRYKGMSLAHYCAGRYEDAVRLAEKARMERPGLPWAHRTLAAAHAELGNVDAARQAAEALLRDAPNLTVEVVMESMPFQRAEIRARFAAGLSAAGLPRAAVLDRAVNG